MGLSTSWDRRKNHSLGERETAVSSGSCGRWRLGLPDEASPQGRGQGQGSPWASAARPHEARAQLLGPAVSW